MDRSSPRSLTGANQEITVGARRFYRVRMGPVDSVEAGDRLLAIVVDAGVPEARLVVD